MEQETNEQETKQPQPVKKKVNKIISYGTTIIVSGLIVVTIGTIILPTHTLGATISAKMKYEQQKKELKKALEQCRPTEPEEEHPNTEN